MSESVTTNDDEEIAKIMAMSDEEILAGMTVDDQKDLEQLRIQTNRLIRCFDAGWNAALKQAIENIQASDDINIAHEMAQAEDIRILERMVKP